MLMSPLLITHIPFIPNYTLEVIDQQGCHGGSLFIVYLILYLELKGESKTNKKHGSTITQNRKNKDLPLHNLQVFSYKTNLQAS